MCWECYTEWILVILIYTVCVRTTRRILFVIRPHQWFTRRIIMPPQGQQLTQLNFNLLLIKWLLKAIKLLTMKYTYFCFFYIYYIFNIILIYFNLFCLYYYYFCIIYLFFKPVYLFFFVLFAWIIDKSYNISYHLYLCTFVI